MKIPRVSGCHRGWWLVWSSGALETSFRGGALEQWLVVGWKFSS